MNMNNEDNNDRKKENKENQTEKSSEIIIPSSSSASSSVLQVENRISSEIPQYRRNEIYEYMKLFGYKPDRTIIQVHITGFFRKKKYSPKDIERQRATTKRYGGTTFTVIGRTHDPSIINNVIKPKKKNPYDQSPGYVGYLWKNKDIQKRSPHEIIPLDFTPIHLPYPTDWKNMFATKGFMLALHVPSSLAKDKNKITRALYRIGKSRVDVKKEWNFINELRNIILYTQHGFEHTQPTSTISTNSIKSKQQAIAPEDPLHVLKMRLAKGDIDKKEYDNLYKTIAS